eukprot:CAMPEP_0176487884 /NCGR_PEP_ID=MMETSP0200_2-20121128/6390_1 /TAXON_ID=947934 /ORGANISM="Chaetoceros sp., Strain GSL56" /LENGTH=350 /DNA_ID=CAMNT_0017884783 /DNA_START=65 /DNA_END=1114 /DNA_ORIENTATION=+
MNKVDDTKVQKVSKQQNTSRTVMMSVYDKEDDSIVLETCEVKHRVDDEAHWRADVEEHQRADAEAHLRSDDEGNERAEVEVHQRAKVEAHQRAKVEAHQRVEVGGMIHVEAHRSVGERAEFQAKKQRAEVEAKQKADVDDRERAVCLATQKDVYVNGSVGEYVKRKRYRNGEGKENHCRGKPIGAKTWSDLETNTLLDAVENILPVSVQQWADVIKLCEENYTGDWKRHKDACKHKFEKLSLFKPAIRETNTIPLAVYRARLIRGKIDKARTKPVIEITGNIEDNSEYKIQLADAIITAVQSVDKNVSSDPKRLEQLEQKIVSSDQRLEQLEQKIVSSDQRLEQLEQKIV